MKRRASEAGAEGRDVQVDGRLIELGIAGRDAQHFAISQSVWPRPTCHARSARPARVSSVRHHDDARDPLAAIPLAHGGDRAGQIRAARIRAEVIDRRWRKAVADRVQRGREVRGQRGQQLVLEERGRARDARLAVGVVDAHAARDVDEHGDDGVA